MNFEKSFVCLECGHNLALNEEEQVFYCQECSFRVSKRELEELSGV